MGLIPGSVGEMKTKPTQHAVRVLGSSGVAPDIIIARSKVAVDDKRKEKIAKFCNVRKENVISAPDMDSIYDIPEEYEKAGVSRRLCDILGIRNHTTVDLKAWKRFVRQSKNTGQTIKKIEADTDRDNYLSASEAKSYGLIDTILTKRK